MADGCCQAVLPNRKARSISRQTEVFQGIAVHAGPAWIAQAPASSLKRRRRQAEAIQLEANEAIIDTVDISAAPASAQPAVAGSEPGTVLVTGASGFLGSSLTRTFRQAGFRVRALVRPSSDRTNLSVPDMEIAPGDLGDAASLRSALKGARYLVHAAADYRLWTRRSDELIRTNVAGTRLLMQAAADAGVERIVYTSSVATLKPPSGLGSSTEIDDLPASDAIGAYKRSKVLAEEAVRDLAARGLPVVIVNPSTPIGPRDVKPTPTGRIIVEAARGRMPAFVDTGLNLAHVDDVAEGHLLALRHGRVGERYILGGQNVFLSAMLAEIARQLGQRPPKVRLPIAAVIPIAAAAEGVARLTGHPPFVSFESLRMARHRMFFDDAKARRELGYRSRPYEQAIADALEWFRAQGRIA